ncbi:MAG: acyl-CoA dehydrogenase family protein [Burkholderiaceae bacterium]
MSTEDSMIAASVERMLGDAPAGDGFAPTVWAALVEAGVPRLLRPEAQGGAGHAWRDAVAVLQAVAAHGARVPLADTLLAHALLSMSALDLDTEDTDDRPIRLVVAGPDGTPDPGDGLSAEAGRVLVLQAWGDRIGATWSTRPDVPPREAVLADGGTVRAMLAIVSAAMIVGAMRASFAAGVDYAGLRRAFGRPIGAFQAVQHPLAVAAEEIAASRAALDWAAAELEAHAGTPASAVAAMVAKARAAEAAGRVAAVIHQVHGAIGFTAEHPLHRWSNLAWRWRDRWGDEHDWQARLGTLALAAGPAGLFDLLDGRIGA